MRKLFWFLPLMLVGCVSTHDLGNGRVAVPRTAEVRSPYGTNVTFGKLDDCEKAVAPNKGAQEWINCVTLVEWHIVSSQGQGGQITAGALQAAGLGILGATMPANVTSAAQSQSVTVAPRGHH